MSDLPAGMVPWNGGEIRPADWDGGLVLCANGIQTIAPRGYDWLGPFDDNHVVAYTPNPSLARGTQQ